MSAVDKEFFNGIFVSYCHDDEKFAKEFRNKLQKKLQLEMGDDCVKVWIDIDIPKGKGWRREIERQLDLSSMVVGVVSLEALKSSWVLYEWHYSLLVLQSEPVLVCLKDCGDRELKKLLDYQLEKLPKTAGAFDSDGAVAEIIKRLAGISDLKKNYNLAIFKDGKKDEPWEPSVQLGADTLGSVSEDLELAAANYLIEALEYWFSRGHSGHVLRIICNNLGRLGKKKAMSVMVQAYAKQANPCDSTNQDILSQIKDSILRLAHKDLL